MTPVEALLDVLDTVAERHAASARSASLLSLSEGYRLQSIVDAAIADALRDVAEEYAAAMGVER